ncbi:hypothetical protein OM076_13610 [Solirubrobacter ginsenosidimutans]|uniref:Uncharacterized protein n=1 Tax=Solirubrobacter ginsenosidimutans TaxID=490573 RepID=A0A9X3S0H5_9ACTN|nr:hypothetical protein [Solirubrobacter ginsenosidimutans]MDA0161309.1 hypothetical protein [Solirubrobacter ginsenosidimutans]
MGKDEQPLLYWLPRSVVRITGSVTVEVSDTGKPVPKRTSDVSIATEAEFGDPLRLTLKERLGAEREFDLRFTADQRLSGATSSSTGVGAKVIEAGVRAVSLVAKLLPAMTAALDAAPGRETVLGALEVEQPDLAARGREARDRVERVQEALENTIDSLAAGTLPDGAEQLKALEEALAAARREAALIEAEVAAWRAERFPPWSQTLSYMVGTDALPVRPNVAERHRVHGRRTQRGGRRRGPEARRGGRSDRRHGVGFSGRSGRRRASDLPLPTACRPGRVRGGAADCGRGTERRAGVVPSAHADLGVDR